MTRFGEIMRNVLIGKRKGGELYNRIFVVSAYGGVTNMLLENKKTGEPGIYGSFAAEDPVWENKFASTRAELLKLNRSFSEIGLDTEKADAFINNRMDGALDCLRHLAQLRSFGHFSGGDYLPAAREMLSSIGEAHSAFNSADILQHNGINALFIDLSGWKSQETGTMEETIAARLNGLDFSVCMPIVTGYAKCSEGVMAKFDRGYSEITFSKIAVVTRAREGVIHKEFHLSTGDPKLIGNDKVRIIGNTNYDIADQLSDMAMEAIHPKASKAMEMNNIPIRVRNAFDPEHPGTLITRDYVSPVPRVDMICGRKDIKAIEIFDPEMVGTPGYDLRILESFNRYKISYIAKNTNANTIVHYVSEKNQRLKECLDNIAAALPTATMNVRDVAIIGVIGTNMKIPGFLSRAAESLAAAGINVLALDQCMRQVNMQFIISRGDFETAQKVLHRELVEKEDCPA